MKVVEILKTTQWSDVKKALQEQLLNFDTEQMKQYERFYYSLSKIRPADCDMVYYIKPTLYDKVLKCEKRMPRSFVITEFGEMSYYSAGYIMRSQLLGMHVLDKTLKEFSYPQIMAKIVTTLLSLGFNESTAIKRYKEYYIDKPLITD